MALEHPQTIDIGEPHQDRPRPRIRRGNSRFTEIGLEDDQGSSSDSQSSSWGPATATPAHGVVVRDFAYASYTPLGPLDILLPQRRSQSVTRAQLDGIAENTVAVYVPSGYRVAPHPFEPRTERTNPIFRQVLSTARTICALFEANVLITSHCLTRPC